MFKNPTTEYFAHACLTAVYDKIGEEPHRFYHTIDHIERMIKKFAASGAEHKMDTIGHVHAFIAAIAFHDSVYDPTRSDNEEQSVALMRRTIHPSFCLYDCPWDLDLAERLILSTKTLKTEGGKMEMALQHLDCDLIINGSMVELITYEDQIFKEFQFVEHSTYVSERKRVLNKIVECYPQLEQKVEFLKSYVDAKRPRVGLYVGSFDPFHVGHMDITIKASRLFDKVIVVQCRNPAKNLADTNIMNVDALRFFERSVRTTTIKEIVDSYSKDYDVVIVRGLRNGLDLTYEFDYNKWLEAFGVRNQVVYIPADSNLIHVSSSALRGLATMAPEVASKYIV